MHRSGFEFSRLPCYDFVMASLQMRVAEYIGQHDLLPSGSTVVVGVSGGADSLCLLHLLRELTPALGIRLHVAHLNHGLRGVEADADAAFVAGLAAQWGLPCTVGRAEVAALAAAPGVSLEEAARHARYRFLAGVAAEVGAGVVAVGHNADDQAETVLMHFLRGSGVAGLRGMLPKVSLAAYRLTQHAAGSILSGAGVGPSAESKDVLSGVEGDAVQTEDRSAPFDSRLPPSAQGAPLECFDAVWRPEGDDNFAQGIDSSVSPCLLVRPLLNIPRAEIEAYCAQHGLAPRFDRSNEDTTLFRNRLRHELLPLLATYNPNIRAILTHTAEALAGDYEVLREQTLAAWARISLLAGPGEVRFDLARWRALPVGLQRATVREAVAQLRRHLRDIGWEHVEAAVRLARRGATGQAATLPAGLVLTLSYGVLRVAEEGAAWPVDVPQVAGPVALGAERRVDLGHGWRVHAVRCARSELPADFAANPDPWAAWLDADAVGPALQLRPRTPGDRFRPQGMGGHEVRVNEFMINAKTPRAARAGWPLLVGRFGIAWLPGLRLDERAAIGPATRWVWHVCFTRERKVDSPAQLPTLPE